MSVICSTAPDLTDLQACEKVNHRQFRLWSGVTVALALVAFVEVMRGTNSNMLIYVSKLCLRCQSCLVKV